MFEVEAVPHSYIPQVQIGLCIDLYMRILLEDLCLLGCYALWLL
jgi:hypothetical protein